MAGRSRRYFFTIAERAINTAFAGRWGVTYSANLRADNGIGLGLTVLSDDHRLALLGESCQKLRGVGVEVADRLYLR
jgi:hypothetical protein